MVVSKQNKCFKTAQKTPYFRYCLFCMVYKVILCDIRPDQGKPSILHGEKIPALYPVILEGKNQGETHRENYWYAIPGKIRTGEKSGETMQGKNQDRETARKNRTCRKISIYIDMVISRASQLVDMGISMDIEKNIENLKGNRNFPENLKGGAVFRQNLKEVETFGKKTLDKPKTGMVQGINNKNKGVYHGTSF